MWERMDVQWKASSQPASPKSLAHRLPVFDDGQQWPWGSPWEKGTHLPTTQRWHNLANDIRRFLWSMHRWGPVFRGASSSALRPSRMGSAGQWRGFDMNVFYCAGSCIQATAGTRARRQRLLNSSQEDTSVACYLLALSLSQKGCSLLRGDLICFHN